MPLSSATTLEAVASHFPERTMTVEERAREMGLNEAQVNLFRKIHGLDVLHVDPAGNLYDLVLPPAREVLDGTAPEAVRYVLYVHATTEVAPAEADIAQEIKRRLGLHRATAFSMTHQSCSTTLTAVDIAGTLLRADGDPDAKALVVSGEKLFARDMRILFNSCVFAEGAASALVGLSGEGAEIRSLVTRTFGEYFDGVHMTPAQHRESGGARPGVVREVIEEAVERAGIALEDLHLVLPTNSNTNFWAESIRQMDFDVSKFFFDNIPRYSHCMAADALINYVTLRDEGRLAAGRPHLFLSFGLGMTYAAGVFVPKGVA
ncbi:3-oxoacyl-[acyl-carrier-protein] synthase III C-terminal domain-containing protein [Streptomyces sp. RerS4]|uniref:3-oxoacyl-[acyl-carrier-protein] synthase III C-terminal domain-containing protein n=1 Tax=Streptomyces sp. RerS4 TaxID=2942449 RepID=UPI00201C6C33|nr:3-oxoacyl-[acyl-carrier-protein] synthase III C-terminal domain-containing protein [Streptomyces sp. RerS4]UQX03435.1 3-oxoacyl-ACP synthase [Streptomyces sp. RerS4]